MKPKSETCQVFAYSVCTITSTSQRTAPDVLFSPSTLWAHQCPQQEPLYTKSCASPLTALKKKNQHCNKILSKTYLFDIKKLRNDSRKMFHLFVLQWKHYVSPSRELSLKSVSIMQSDDKELAQGQNQSRSPSGRQQGGQCQRHLGCLALLSVSVFPHSKPSYCCSIVHKPTSRYVSPNQRG